MKSEEMLADLPKLFLIFLTSFVAIKTIFIIFFNTPYDPPFILHLSPLHILSSVTNLQLLLVSLFLTAVNLYFHIKEDDKSRICSIVITSLMVVGISISVAYSKVSIEMAVEYTMFLFLLVLLVSDIKPYIAKQRMISHSSLSRDFSKSGREKGIPSHNLKSSYYRVSSDLVLIDDMDKEHIEILNDIGIRSVDDLASVDASKLVKGFKDYIRELENAVSNLTEDRIEEWIETAKNLINERNRFRNA